MTISSQAKLLQTFSQNDSDFEENNGIIAYVIFVKIVCEFIEKAK